MDFLNQAIAQVSELFRSMTPGARITSGLLLAVVVVSFGYLFQHAATGPDAYLFGGEALPDGQLTRVEAAIAQAGLSGYVREGNRIRVPAGQQAAYLAAVADAGALPPNFNTILENALDKGGPWESREATRERLKIAKQQALSEIIRAMPWVENAAVLFGEQRSRAANSLAVADQVTVSVNVQPIVGESLESRRLRNIEKLVASAVGMSQENVTVTNLGEGTGNAGDDSIDPDIFEKSDYFRTKVAFEMQKRNSIVNALRDIPGVRVEVNAELDSTAEEMTRDIKPDPKAVIAREVTSLDESTQAADQSGRPGLEAQGPNRQLPNAAAPPSANKQKVETSETVMDVGRVATEVTKHGLTPKEVWATVTIPGKYVEDIWKQRNPTVTEPPKPEDVRSLQGEVIAKVENIVEPLLLLQTFRGQDNYKHVKVVVLDSLPVPTIEPPSMASTAVAWTGRYWSTLAMVGVAMFSLLILRSVVRGTPTTEAAAATSGAPTLTLHSDEPAKTTQTENNNEGEEETDRPRLRLKKGKSLKDDLVEIVREDPDAAADILRTWIGKAS